MLKMATDYNSKEQRTNYSRLCRAIIDLSADVLRKLLKRQVSPSNILTEVKKNPESNKVIKKDHWSIIYDAVSLESYDKFDFTLLILVLRLLSVQDVCSLLETSIQYQPLQTTLQKCPALSSEPQTKLSQQEFNDLQLIITKKSYADGGDELLWKFYKHLCAFTKKNLVHPSVKWGNAEMPDPAHITVGDDVERLRHLRNEAYARVSTTEITKQEFDRCWKELDGVMVRMDRELPGHNFKASLDEIRTVCMDPNLEKQFLEEVKIMANNDKKRQDEFKDNVTKNEIKEGVQQVKDSICIMRHQSHHSNVQYEVFDDKEDDTGQEKDVVTRKLTGECWICTCSDDKSYIYAQRNHSKLQWNGEYEDTERNIESQKCGDCWTCTYTGNTNGAIDIRGMQLQVPETELHEKDMGEIKGEIDLRGMQLQGPEAEVHENDMGESKGAIDIRGMQLQVPETELHEKDMGEIKGEIDLRGMQLQVPEAEVHEYDMGEIKGEIDLRRMQLQVPETELHENDMGESKDHTILQIDRHEEDKTFVVTPAVSKGIDILLQHGILIYSGGPGQGKTKNALETMKQIREKYPDWKFIELDDVRKWRSLIDPYVPSVILLDDVIGKTNINDVLINDGDEHFLNILADIKQGKVKIIVTICNIFLSTNKVKLEQYKLFDSSYTIDLTTRQFKLNEDTKRTILLKHCENNNIETCFFKDKNNDKVDIKNENSLIKIENSTISNIVKTDPVLGFPFSCYLFCCKRKYTRLGVKFFSKPNQYIIEEIGSLIKSEATRLEKIQYCVLVYILMKKGTLVGELDIDLLKRITRSIEISEPPTKMERKEAIEKLLDKYIVSGVNSQYEFKHQTILESVAVCFCEDDPCLLLEVCSQDFITEFVRPENFEETEGEIVCKIDRKVYNTVVNRFMYSIENGRYWCSYQWWINHPLLQNEEFVNCLVDKIQSKSNNNQLCIVEVFRRICLYSKNTLILEKLHTVLTPTQFKKISVQSNFETNILKWLIDHNFGNNRDISYVVYRDVSYVNHPCSTLTEVVTNLKRAFFNYNCSVIKAIFNRWPCIESCHVLEILQNFICKGLSLDCIKTIVNCRPDFITDVVIKRMFTLACIADKNNLEVIKYLLSLDKGNFNRKAFHINYAIGDNLTNLHLAAFYGKVDVCKKLIELGLRLDVRTVSGLSVLQVAILGYCCRHRDITIIQSYSKKLADFVTSMNSIQGYQVYNELFKFICIDNRSIIDDTEFDMSVDNFGSKLVHHFAGNGNLSMLELLYIINKRLVHATNKDNMSVLHIAVLLGRLDTFLTFVKFATGNPFKSRLSILEVAFIGMINVIPKSVLLALNLSPICQSPLFDYCNRWTDPFRNPSSSYIETITYLMQNGFDKDLKLAVDKFGSAIVISCVFCDNLPLLDKIYDIEKTLFHVTNAKNISAIHFAALLGKFEIFMKLVEFGASVSVSCLSGLDILRFVLTGFTQHSLNVFLDRLPFFRNTIGTMDIDHEYRYKYGTLQSYEQIITYLLHQTKIFSSDLGMVLDECGNCFIHYCVIFNSVSLIQLLHTKHQCMLSEVIAKKSKNNSDIRNRQMTPIQLSVIMGRTEIMKLLLSCIDVVDTDIDNLIQLVSEGKKYVGYDFEKYKTPEFLQFVRTYFESSYNCKITFGSDGDYQSISKTLVSLNQEK